MLLWSYSHRTQNHYNVLMFQESCQLRHSCWNEKALEQRHWLLTDVGGVQGAFKVFVIGWKGACCPSLSLAELPGSKENPSHQEIPGEQGTVSSFIKPDLISHEKQSLKITSPFHSGTCSSLLFIRTRVKSSTWLVMRELLSLVIGVGGERRDLTLPQTKSTLRTVGNYSQVLQVFPFN